MDRVFVTCRFLQLHQAASLLADLSRTHLLLAIGFAFTMRFDIRGLSEVSVQKAKITAYKV